MAVLTTREASRRDRLHERTRPVLFFVEFGRDSRTPRAHVLAVDADRDAHDHVLGPFRDVAVAAHEVGPLQRLEAEVVVFKVAVVDDGAVDLVLVRPAAVWRVMRDVEARRLQERRRPVVFFLILGVIRGRRETYMITS